nr:anaphase-promoting complex subunit 13 isoform X1 [Monopterus albus]
MPTGYVQLPRLLFSNKRANVLTNLYSIPFPPKYLEDVSEIAVSLRLAPSEETLRPARRMDSEIQRDGRVLDLTDDAWREDKLPYEDVTIPLSELPEAEQDNGGSTESVKEQEMKWTDLALQSLHENTPSTGS